MEWQLWKTVRRALKELHIQGPHDPATPLLDVHPKEGKAGTGRSTRAPVFTAALLLVAKGQKQAKSP